MKVHEVGPERLSASTAIVVLIASMALPLVGSAAPPVGVDPPTGVVATALSTSSIRVTWNDVNSQESGYEVERSLSSGSGFSVVHTSGPNAQAFTDSGRSANTRYYYRLRAFEPGKGNKPPVYSGYSATVSAQTFAAVTTTTSTFTTSTFTTSTVVSSTTSTTTGGGNLPPVAVAGPDGALAVGQLGGFDGRQSYDPDGSIVAYLWNFGDGGPWGNSAFELRSYSSPGTYTVTLYVQDDDGTWALDSLQVTVGGSATTTSTSTSTTSTTVGGGNQLPVSNAGPNRTLSVGQVGTFDGRSSFDPDGFIVAYLWNFGDGGPWGSSALEFHSYSSPGTYVATLYVQDDDGVWAADTAIVTVQSGGTTTSTTTTTSPPNNQSPIANAGPDKQGSVGQTLTFDGRSSFDPDGSLVGYVWLWGDGASSHTALATHVYQAAGTYTVQLWVQDDDGAWSNDAAVVTVTGASSAGWALGLGSTSGELGKGVRTTPDGQMVLGGIFNGTTNFGGGSLVSAGGTDVVVAKYTATGGHVWSRRYGGTASESLQGLAVDGSGNVIMGGDFSGSPANLGGANLGNAGARDAWVAKYSPTGAHVWSRRFGTVADDAIYDLAVDASGNVLVTGAFIYTVDFGSGYVLTRPSNTVFVAKLSGATGATLWARTVEGTSDSIGAGIAVDGSGNVLVTGSFLGAIDFGTGSLQALNGRYDVFVAKLTGATGAAVWARRLGDGRHENGYDIAVDGSGRVVVLGEFEGTVDFGPTTLASAGMTDLFVAQLAGGTGTVTWARRLGNSDAEQAARLAVTSGGEVAVTGTFRGTLSTGAETLVSEGSTDLLFVRYAANGTLISAVRGGGSGNDKAGDIAYDASGRVVLTGGFLDTAEFSGTILTAPSTTFDTLLWAVQP